MQGTALDLSPFPVPLCYLIAQLISHWWFTLVNDFSLSVMLITLHLHHHVMATALQLSVYWVLLQSAAWHKCRCHFITVHVMTCLCTSGWIQGTRAIVVVEVQHGWLLLDCVTAYTPEWGTTYGLSPRIAANTTSRRGVWDRDPITGWDCECLGPSSGEVKLDCKFSVKMHVVKHLITRCKLIHVARFCAHVDTSHLTHVGVR